jgi:hypothetical protein
VRTRVPGFSAIARCGDVVGTSVRDRVACACNGSRRAKGECGGSFLIRALPVCCVAWYWGTHRVSNMAGCWLEAHPARVGLLEAAHPARRLKMTQHG